MSGAAAVLPVREAVRSMTTSVLVIDDDDAIRETLRMILHDEGGYVVLEAAEASRGLDQLRRAPQGVVVLFDYRMSRVNGADLLALADQEQALAERHSFVCMTAVSRTHLPATLVTLLARYDVPLVTKPFDLDNLLEVIRLAEQRLAQLPVWSAMRGNPPGEQRP